MRRVGYQPHDGRIFETLVGRGGVLVAIRSEPRAADALAILHSYGGGNAGDRRVERTCLTEPNLPHRDVQEVPQDGEFRNVDSPAAVRSIKS